MQKEYILQSALESSGDNNATIHYFKINTIWSVDLSENVKLVPLKEELAREEHVTSLRAKDPPGASSAVSLSPDEPFRLRCTYE